MPPAALIQRALDELRPRSEHRQADKLSGVFQRLQRAEDYEGTGVEFALTQRIVQRHGGGIWAEAAVDQGAAFYFTLGE